MPEAFSCPPGSSLSDKHTRFIWVGFKNKKIKKRCKTQLNQSQTHSPVTGSLSFYESFGHFRKHWQQSSFEALSLQLDYQDAVSEDCLRQNVLLDLTDSRLEMPPAQSSEGR